MRIDSYMKGIGTEKEMFPTSYCTPLEFSHEGRWGRERREWGTEREEGEREEFGGQRGRREREESGGLRGRRERGRGVR